MEFRNTNALWSAVFMRTLRNAGVRTVVVSPGSRSTPLTAAAAGLRGLECVPALDERSAGFFALGLAKSTARPVALVCTSGTAVANYLPAVVEAKMSRTPLVVVTADRPPEFQNRHAGQTIPQRGIFSAFVVREKNCVPEKTWSSLEEARSAAADAVRAAAGECAPVHVNVQLRDPLAPAVFEDGFPGENFVPVDFDPAKFCLVPSLPLRDFLAESAEPAPLSLVGKKVLVVAGTTPVGHDDTFNVERLSREFSAPILADATHLLRHFPPARERLVERYDAIFRTAEKPYAPALDALRPDVVLQLGALPESKFLRAWLASLGETPVYLFNYCGDDTDALRRPNAIKVSRRFRDVWNNVFSGGNAADAAPADTAFLDAWRAADARFREKSDAFFRNAACAGTPPLEPQIARFLCENLPESETALFVANGMPVRDMNAFCPAGSRFWTFCNRGANGIDGTLSTALGVAHGCMEQTILYTGDLSLLHDTNGFLLAPQFRGNLSIVLQNNGGGNIFLHLPVAKENPYFERFWLTPQRVSFERLAAAYGVDYARAETLAELGAALARFRSRRGVHLIEIFTDGEASRRLRAELSR